MKFVNRLAEKELRKWLNKSKALVITGARQVGKTTLLKHMFSKEKDVLWMNADETSVRERLQILNIESLKSVVGNKKLVIIDEIQRIPDPGLLLKILADNFQKVQFIATGSSALEISETVFEPLTGRYLLFHLQPFSFLEMHAGLTPFEWEQKLPFHLIYGSYPDVYNFPDEAETLLKNLANQYLYKDILVWKALRKPELLEKLLMLLAFQIGSEVSFSELATQLKVKSETVESYINILEKALVIFRLPAFSNNPRKEVSKMQKIYFRDLGIRNAVIDQFNTLELRNDTGQLWENFLISERLKINEWKAGNIKSYFWRNYNQSEVDYVETLSGTISAYEMKWKVKKGKQISAAFKNAYPDARTQIITPHNFAEFCSWG